MATIMLVRIVDGLGDGSVGKVPMKAQGPEFKSPAHMLKKKAGMAASASKGQRQAGLLNSLLIHSIPNSKIQA